jgi:hypothetical protein
MGIATAPERQGSVPIESYVVAAFNPQFYNVEMSFPDVNTWPRTAPLTKTLIHFEQDDIEDPKWAMGQPGRDVFNESMGTFVLHEAARHRINYDVGVWTSAASGGETSRMRAVQRLKNLFVPVGAKLDFKEATGGVKVVTFDGGRNHLDRINDLPVYRSSEMTLVVEVFSRHIPEFEEIIPGDYDQNQNLVIDDNQPV